MLKNELAHVDWVSASVQSPLSQPIFLFLGHVRTQKEIGAASVHNTVIHGK